MTEEGTETNEFTYPDKFVSEFGDEFPLPRPVASIEKQVFEQVGILVQEFPVLKDLIGQFMGMGTSPLASVEKGEQKVDNVLGTVEAVLMKAPEPLARMASSLTKSPVDEIEEKLTYADMVRLVLLFVRLQTSRFASIAQSDDVVPLSVVADETTS